MRLSIMIFQCKIRPICQHSVHLRTEKKHLADFFLPADISDVVFMVGGMPVLGVGAAVGTGGLSQVILKVGSGVSLPSISRTHLSPMVRRGHFFTSPRSNAILQQQVKIL